MNPLDRATILSPLYANYLSVGLLIGLMAMTALWLLAGFGRRMHENELALQPGEKRVEFLNEMIDFWQKARTKCVRGALLFIVLLLVALSVYYVVYGTVIP